MRWSKGQILRTCGLLIELVGAMVLFSERRGSGFAPITLPGGTRISPAWIVFAIGLVMWLIGTTLVFGSRSRGLRS